MDKKTEIAMAKRKRVALHEEPATSKLAATATATLPPPPAGWWMYHGDPAHTGFVSDSNLNTATVASTSFQTLFTLQLGGPILSVPAVTEDSSTSASQIITRLRAAMAAPCTKSTSRPERSSTLLAGTLARTTKTRTALPAWAALR